MDILIRGVTVITLIEIIIKLLKVFNIPSKFLPHLNVLTGIVLLVLAKWGGLDYTWLETIVIGIISGASCAGLYDGRKELGLHF